MKFDTKEEYKNIQIEECDFSGRTYNLLRRSSIDNLYQLVCRYNEGLKKIKGVGDYTVREVEEFLFNIDIWQQGMLSEENANDFEFLERMKETPIEKLKLGTRAYNALKNSCIDTVFEFLSLSLDDLYQINNLGVASIEQVLEIKKYIQKEKDEFFIEDTCMDNESVLYNKDFDIPLINELKNSFGFQISWLMEWFGISRQRIYQKLDQKNKNYDNWTGKLLSEKEYKDIIQMCEVCQFHIQKEEIQYYLLNNLKDNCVILCVNMQEIKCFYLKDLPNEIQDIIKRNHLHKLSQDEIKYGVGGVIVNILKVPYFKPDNIQTFRVLAAKRNLNLDEYAMFISGYPYYAGKTITDNQIINFFEANLVNGKVYISSSSKNQWIRSYASRNNYTLRDFIEFFGYESAGTEHDKSFYARENHIVELNKLIVYDNVVYLDTASSLYGTLATYAQKNGLGINEYIESLGYKRTLVRPIKNNLDEKDMESYSISDDAKLIDKIYAKYPLIGNYVFSEKNLEKLNTNAKGYLDKLIDDSGYFKAENIISAELQITLAVINYAKKWVSEEDASFWSYIASQFGYRDNGYGVREILCRCIEDSMRHQNRLFLTDINGNLYKATVVIHAFATKKTWMLLYDFLFDFYTNNLNWSYIDNDPSIDQMVRALQKKLGDESEDVEKNESIIISSKVYSFQEGIRKLVLNRPRYVVKMFSRMIKRLDSIIKQEAGPAKTYEEILCDEWIENKLKKILDTKIKSRKYFETKNIAISYDRIRPIYQLENDNTIKLILPDIRLVEGEVGRITLELLYDNQLIQRKELSYYGNEFSRTIHGIKIDLKDFFTHINSSTIKIGIRIICGESTIYESGNTLYRNCLIFDKKTEISVSSCTKKNYIIAIPPNIQVCIENANVTLIHSEQNFFNYYYVQFERDFLFSMNGQIFAWDKVLDDTIRVIIPNQKKDIEYIEDGLKYKIVNKCDVIRIIVKDCDIKEKYIVLINNNRIDLDLLNFEKLSENMIYELPLQMDETQCRSSIQVMDILKNKLILNEQFIITDSIVFEFDKPIYFSKKDYEDAVIECSLSEKQIPIRIGFSELDDVISIPYMKGELVFRIPKMTIYDTETHIWEEDIFYWIEDFSQKTFLYVDLPENFDVDIFLGEYAIPRESDGSFGIGNVLHGLDAQNISMIDLKIRVNSNINKEYSIGKISLIEKFLSSPKLEFIDDKIAWDKGYGFIGEKESLFTLEISTEGELVYSGQFTLQDSYIAQNINLKIGEYEYEILKGSSNIFLMSSKSIAKGKFFVGNINEIKFNNKRIVIDTITYFEPQQNKVVQTKISKIYIDHLKFRGLEIVGDDGELPIYEGVLYFINRHGERKEFSYISSVKENLMKINPVRVALINESVLCLVDNEGEMFDEGDGFYCSSYWDKELQVVKYSFTDKEYSKQNVRFYKAIDLYMYKRERMI